MLIYFHKIHQIILMCFLQKNAFSYAYNICLHILDFSAKWLLYKLLRLNYKKIKYLSDKYSLPKAFSKIFQCKLSLIRYRWISRFSKFQIDERYSENFLGASKANLNSRHNIRFTANNITGKNVIKTGAAILARRDYYYNLWNSLDTCSAATVLIKTMIIDRYHTYNPRLYKCNSLNRKLDLSRAISIQTQLSHFWLQIVKMR